MKQIRYALMAVFIFAGLLAWAEEKNPVFNVITVDGVITSPTAKYIASGIEEAVRDNAGGLIILLDTPGGMDTAMRDIAKSILNSPVPVIVYVSPSGARAASAGVIITQAAHIAAMAPGTNIGAAHPVAIGLGNSGGEKDKTMTEKIENDAAAYARSIAKTRGRSEEWVEKAVRKSESITAEEALKLNVIDYVAADVNTLLAAIHQKEIQLIGGKKIISTKNAVIRDKKMGTRQGILSAISDPNISYLLLLIGLAGLYFELSTPGAILPGVIGGISLLLAFFGLSTLPVSYTGILLIIFGVILFIAEIKVMSHGMLTVGGIISLVMGSLLLFDTPEPALRLSLQVLIPAVVVVSIFFIVIIMLAVKAQMRKHFTGAEAMIDLEAEVTSDIEKEGDVFVKGEYWKAVSDASIKKGAKVRIVKVDGMKLVVEEIKNQK
ncbi:MAG TPA: nodulation protein NfeD [Smithella sp.]|jgi:membrane-bound serine protease (ClpP class)|nr:nodulation protein NfeD [Smithella sp.]HOO34915.1 nodulation protein NfeD [Smithella sp.]HOS13173.1 nodulation protein NfeD [Smithella sp.]HPR15213.1 nodulation protein NfeD [Smithella sp.]HPV51275.1 nodulation protein NfeD [Smithella sp.]